MSDSMMAAAQQAALEAAARQGFFARLAADLFAALLQSHVREWRSVGVEWPERDELVRIADKSILAAQVLMERLESRGRS